MTGRFDISSLVNNNPDEQLKVTLPFNDQVNVTIKYVTRERNSELLKKATKVVYIKHQPVDQFDHLLYGELLGVEAIDGWDGLEVSGEEYPCNDENRKVLMRRWTEFAKFVADVSTDLERLLELQKANAGKNSGSTSEED